MTTSVRLQSVSELLTAAAAAVPERPAVLCGGRSVTFRELDERCSRLAEGLTGRGVGPGVRAALLVPPGIEFVSLAFALFRCGAVPVLVDPGIGWRNMGRCLDEAAPEAFIGSAKAHAARLIGGWGKRTIKTALSPDGALPPRGGARGFGAFGAEFQENGTAAILFTSGSTGAPKGAVYTHGIFAHQAAMLQSHFGIEPGGFSVATFPLFALFDVALGQSAIIPRMDPTRPAKVDPLEIVLPIQKHGAVQLFGSPALLDAVGRYGERHGVCLPSLKRVLSAGAPVPAKVLERLARMLSPGADIHTPYGATEALPVACITAAEVLGETAGLTAQGRGVCVGRPWPGMEVKVIRISDEPISAWSGSLCLPAGQIGEIVVKGPVVTREYFRRPEATALAKIPDGDSLRHRMGDLGYLDEAGRLWFCGRKSHRVGSPPEALFTIPCEGVFNQHPQVRRSALVGVAAAAGQTPVLCVELEPGADRDLVRRELLETAQRFAHTRSIRTVLFHPGFPVDVRHNAKIFREKLAVWAKRRIT
ncbi:MAG: fatty acid CoA ligase family protein [Elusimicrobia bacterium]|nr:fatty acid CoA ligase family protein [Elusimicrobiota bacterium]